MQLKVKRSQREARLGGAVRFCIDVRAEFTSDEERAITRYRLANELLYTSDGAKRAAEGSLLAAEAAKNRGGSIAGVRNADDFLFSVTETVGHGLKSAALGAVAALKLKITVDSLRKGHHIECNTLEEVLGAENALMEACQNMKVYLDTAAMFNGMEVVIEFGKEGQPAPVAIAEGPKLVAPDAAPLSATVAPSIAAPAMHFEPAPSLTAAAAQDDSSAKMLRILMFLAVAAVILFMLMKCSTHS
jgi:hypothetical protein